jgi:hypothetical protein
MLHVPRCIIEHEKTLGKAICLGLKDVDGMLDLLHELLCTEVSVTILAGFEYNLSLPTAIVDKNKKERKR